MSKKRKKCKVGIDIGGTFTDIIAIQDSGETWIHKTLSTPHDSSVGFINGLRELAEIMRISFESLIEDIDTIVHGTTVATNALLTLNGAKTALITTGGLRDALEMRRGIREEQYNNHYTNVEPLVQRYLRFGIQERMDAAGRSLLKPTDTELQKIVKKIKEEEVESVAVCFMHSYLNPVHEKKVVSYLRKHLKHIFITASHEVLPSIRFYERISTTAVSAFVGPIVSRYMDNLQKKLKEVNYRGQLMIMQSNGGVVTPEVVKKNPAVTVLSGPAAAPTAGAFYAGLLGYQNCITVDMGGTSFDAALVINRECVTSNEGSINRYRIALPSLDIITIGAGGGSIGWINDGGMLRMGPQSAGAMPGPVCYKRGGELPTCTDADVLLGYLNPEFFAGGRLPLDKEKAAQAIQKKLADKLGMNARDTAAGMYRIINSNMAQGVRQISVERGYDPREFLFIVAGGAGSVHAAEICKELEIPVFLVPNVSSIFCAAGMLLGDLKHDYIRSCFSSFSALNKKNFISLFEEMKTEGEKTLQEEGISVRNMKFIPSLDMRYAGQYHEVTLECDWNDIIHFKLDKIYNLFHAEHNRQFGYELKEEKTDMELINIRLRAIGLIEKPSFSVKGVTYITARQALKEHREVYIPESDSYKKIPVYNGDLPIQSEKIQGPCLIEKITTSIFVSESFDCIPDEWGSYLVYSRSAYPNGIKQKKGEPEMELTQGEIC